MKCTDVTCFYYVFICFFYVLALIYKVVEGFCGRFHGIIWECLALFYSVFAFQVFFRCSCTPGSMNSRFIDFFHGMLKRYFRGCSGLFRGKK